MSDDSFDHFFDHIVIGGGIVGIATARSLHRARPDARVLVLEKEDALGRHQTGHNSGVIHAGVYYQPGSLKARLCRAGAERTRQFAAQHGIPVNRCGKLLVATTDDELARMADLLDRARANGVHDAEILDRAELRRREPNVAGIGALFVPETSVIDYQAVTRGLADEVRSAGGTIETGVPVTGLDEGPDAVTVRTRRGDYRAAQVICCGGAQADRLARMAGLDADLAIVPFRGEYWTVAPQKADVVRHLIYPIPDPALPFLGVHLTPTVDGGLTVGPSAVLGLAREKYPRFSFDRRDAAALARFPGTWKVARTHVATGARELANSLWKRSYLRACRRYCPSLELDDLLPREAGIRAQAVRRDGSFVEDFLIKRTARTLHVLNAPSPAATSALPIGEHIARTATAA